MSVLSIWDRVRDWLLSKRAGYRRMTTSGPEDLPGFVSSLRARAGKLRRNALIVIILIGGVLVGGGVAFYFAGELASREHTQALALERQNKASRMQRQIDDYNSRIEDNLEEINSLQRRIFQEKFLEKPDSSPGPVLSNLQTRLDQAFDRDGSLRKFLETLNQQQLGLREGSDLASDQGLQVPPSSYGTLVSAIATRVGLIVLLLFLVRILVPLYRYSIRLASYYDARADALELTCLRNSEGDDELFEKLASILSSDNIDFSEAPASPAHEVLDFVKQVVTSKKTG